MVKYHLCKLDFKLWGKPCVQVAPHFFRFLLLGTSAQGKLGCGSAPTLIKRPKLPKEKERVLASHSPTLVNPFFIPPQAISHRCSTIIQEEITNCTGMVFQSNWDPTCFQITSSATVCFSSQFQFSLYCPDSNRNVELLLLYIFSYMGPNTVTKCLSPLTLNSYSLNSQTIQ